MRIPRFSCSFYDKAAASHSELAHSSSLEMCFTPDGTDTVGGRVASIECCFLLNGVL